MAAIAVALGVVAAWPIYRTGWLVVVAIAGLVVGVGLGLLVSARHRWPIPVLVAVIAAVFALTVVPVSMPGSLERIVADPLQSLGTSLPNALGSALAAVVLGWKQLLTLTLPVGTYQTVLVPAYLVFLAPAFCVTAARRSRFAPLAAIPLIVPVAFGTFFGGSEVSPPLDVFGVASIPAPREFALWFAAAVLGASWVNWVSEAERRGALRRLARGGGSAVRAVRLTLAVSVVVIAAFAAILLAPIVGNGDRAAPRDEVVPEVVLHERPSPLAAYRLSKQDDAIDVPLFRVEATGELPPRLRLAVLDAYDGVDFHVSGGSGGSGFGRVDSGRYTRFPSAGAVPDPVDVTVRIEAGYEDIWMPTAGLGSVPVFTGERADALTDALYVNRATGAAIVVPGGSETTHQGLREGDGYRARMSGASEPEPAGRPAVDGAQFELETMPELAAWVSAQGQPADAAGLEELIRRLRARGYLSHSLDAGGAAPAWFTRLSDRHGTRFWPTAGGHSVARIEQMFGQLNAQEHRVGATDPAAADRLVAAVGDDEQFAAAGALLARALGFDSRVVLGVRLESAEPVPGVPDCAEICTGRISRPGSRSAARTGCGRRSM